MKRFFVVPAAAITVLVWAWLTPARADENWITAGFASLPAAVTVDVVDLGLGTTVGDDLATAQITIDGATSIYHQFDLATVTGYPTDCAQKTYLIEFIPDAADCSTAGTPALCATSVVRAGGGCPTPNSGFYVHTATVITAQGITQDVLDWYAARGMLTLKWVKARRSNGSDFSSPDATMWQVYFYQDGGAAPRIKCVVETGSDPSVSLPSSSHCI